MRRRTFLAASRSPAPVAGEDRKLLLPSDKPIAPPDFPQASETVAGHAIRPAQRSESLDGPGPTHPLREFLRSYS